MTVGLWQDMKPLKWVHNYACLFNVIEKLGFFILFYEPLKMEHKVNN